ncbi:MAG: terminase small subunit, partial [Clostridiaceae bacterium]|nr:terminase small subunit [Clostridiaceae bacterium]
MQEIEDAPLTDKEKDFCIHYIGSYNATQSAYKAGYKGRYGTIRSFGYELLQKPKVRNLIDYLKRMKRETILAGVDDVIDLHMRIAFSDMSGFMQWGNDGEHNAAYLMPSEMVDGNLIKSISVGKTTKIELEDRQKSLDFLERY